MGLRKKLTSDFCEIANRWVFLFYPLYFRLKWVKSGKITGKNFFLSFSHFWGMVMVSWLVQKGCVMGTIYPSNAKKLHFQYFVQKNVFSLVYGTKSYFFTSVLGAGRCSQDLQFWDFGKKIKTWYLFRFILSTLRKFIVACLRTFFRLLEVLYLYL